ncbi:hypothetical protein B4N89_46065 [Embleya scabrispora]|uniref:Uncharacterized protein n=1 Tax=Embleya scabrispora TaxID=159449 RepID=A0A1T3NJP8_9ACTN|nr:hypothetical protein B4N89_46065 [Embleya scabrispora]
MRRIDALAAGVASPAARLGLVLTAIALVPLATGRTVVSGWIAAGCAFTVAAAATVVRWRCEAHRGVRWVPTDTVESLTALTDLYDAVLDVGDGLDPDNAQETRTRVRAALSAGLSATRMIRAHRERGDTAGADQARRDLDMAVKDAESVWLRCAELIATAPPAEQPTPHPPHSGRLQDNVDR